MLITSGRSPERFRTVLSIAWRRIKLKGESDADLRLHCRFRTADASPENGNRPKYHRDLYEVTGAPRYMVQVIFHDVAPGNQYVAGRPAPADQILIRCDTRSGKPNEQRTQMVRRIMQDVGRASGAAEDAVTVLLCEIPHSEYRGTRPRRARPRGGRRMVLVATRRHAGTIQALGLTNSKRTGTSRLARDADVARAPEPLRPRSHYSTDERTNR